MLTPSAQQALGQIHHLIASGQCATAFTMAKQLLRQFPNEPRLLHLRAMAERGLGMNEDARRTFDTLLKLQPRNHAAWNDYSLALSGLGRWQEARQAIDKALQIAPADPTLGATKANLCFALGDIEACQAIVDEFATAGADNSALAIVFAKLAPRRGREQQAASWLERCLANTAHAPRQRMLMHLQLANMRDRLNDIPRAFQAYVAGNNDRNIDFDPDENDRRVDKLIAAWSPETIAKLPRAKVDASRAVFIVGMPRSATSLLEQILASHPRAAGAGELNDINAAAHPLSPSESHLPPMMTDPGKLTQPVVDRIAREYLNVLRKVSPVAQRVSDKMPLNFLHLGFIRQVLPGARVIHSVRNPIDTCWSCFTQSFAGHNAFAYNLTNLGRFYRSYERVMLHWKQTLDLPIHDVIYEDLLADPEAHVQRMLEFLGLEWDDRCMKFHENKRVVLTASQDQVRQKLFTTSKGRWRRYEHHLGPLVTALGDSVKPEHSA